MMMPTHMSVSSLIAVPLVWKFPESSATVMFVALISSLIPDLDTLYGKHRKTMHLPVIYSLMILASLLLVSLISSLLTSLVFLITVVLSFHCYMDILTGGSCKKPFPDIESEACYNHIKKSWIEPVGIVDYTGSIDDYLIFVSTMAISYYWTEDILPTYFTYLFSALVLISTLYVVVKKSHAIYLKETVYTFISRIRYND